MSIASIGSYACQPGPGTLATVYVEVAGHNELVTLYTDESGETPGPNPLPVDGSGWIRIFAETGQYTMRLDQRSPGGFNYGLNGPTMIEVA